MPSHSKAERLALAGALTAAGPGAPTLCAGWTTNDLAAHLVVRERRPDSLPGLILSSRHPLHRWTDRVLAGFARRDYDELVQAVRTGPPRISWAALPGVDARVNLLEHFVHCEDVRRAGGDDWQARELPAGREEALWTALLGAGRMLLRRSPVPVTLQTPAGLSRRIVAGTGGSSNNRGNLPGVVITGAPAELVLFTFGRGTHATVTVDGPPEAVTAFSALRLHA